MAQVEADPHIKSLKAVFTAVMIYRHFSDATIDIRILQQPLYDALWVPKLPILPLSSTRNPSVIKAFQPYVLDRPSSFAYITMFESGQYNVDPNDLENVMTISSGDSLYIGAELLHDPIRAQFRFCPTSCRKYRSTWYWFACITHGSVDQTGFNE